MESVNLGLRVWGCSLCVPGRVWLVTLGTLRVPGMGDRARSSWKVSRAPFCGREGEEGAWGGDTSPELCPEGKDKSQTPLKPHHHTNEGCVTKSTGS